VLKIPSDGAIYLEKFDRSAGNLDERDHHSRTGAVRRNDDFLPVYGLLQVVHLEGHVRDSFDKVRYGRILPVPHPLDSEEIALMITHRDSQVGKIDFPFKASRYGDADVTELHSNAVGYRTLRCIEQLDLRFAEGLSAPDEAPGRVRQLRDPGIFKESGRTHLLYSIAGESGLAIAEVPQQ
jgi:hypothetical protein